MLMSPKMGGDTSLPPSTFLTLALPFFSDIRMLQNDPTLGPEIDAKQKKRWFDWHALADPGV